MIIKWVMIEKGIIKGLCVNKLSGGGEHIGGDSVKALLMRTGTSEVSSFLWDGKVWVELSVYYEDFEEAKIAIETVLGRE